jgi:hypothetical protein
VRSRASGLRGLAPSALLGLGVVCSSAAWACGETRGRILWGPLDAEPSGDAAAGDSFDDAAAQDGSPASPRPLALTLASVTQANGGHGATRRTFDTCPPGYAVIGYQGGLTALAEAGVDGGLGVWLGRIQPLCGAVELANASSTHLTVVDDGTALLTVGETEDSSWVRKCDVDEIVVGLEGRYGSFVDNLIVVCAHWSVSPVGTFFVDSTRSLEPLGGGGGNTAFTGGQCPAGQMAVGTIVTWGFYVDSLALECGVPSETD